VDLLTIFQSVWRVENDPIVRLEAVQDLERGAIVAPDGERLQMHMMTGVDHHGA
jgi:hypothetical protein